MKTISSIVTLSLLINLAYYDEKEQTVTVAGRVLDYQARPVEGAVVICYELEPGIDRHNIWDRWKANIYEPIGRTSTGPDGRFSFRMAKTKDFSPHIVAGKDGLALGWYHYIHKSAPNPTILLGKPSQFNGTVVDEAGRPVPGARVRICLRNRMMAKSAEIAPLDPENWFITHTDEDGKFVFHNIPKGATADFEVKAPGRASIWTFCDSGLDAGERFPAGQTDIRIELPAETCLSGIIVDEHTGKALAGVGILARPYNSAGWHDHYCPDAVQTDTDGRFELIGLTPTTYQLEAIFNQAISACLTVTLEDGQIMRDVKIPLSRGIPFEVAVYDAAEENAIEDAEVTVTQKPADSLYETFSQTVITDADGLARLHVPPGECEVRIFKSDYGMSFEPQRVQIDPTKAMRREISLLRTACILSGEVLDEQGQPLPNVSVMQMSFGPRALTDANGYFDTSHVQYNMLRLPSMIRVLVRHKSKGLGAVGVLEDPNKSGRPFGRIILKPSYTLTGTVIDTDGRGIPAAYVKLLLGRYRTFITDVYTDHNGVYYIRSIPGLKDNIKDSYVVTATSEGYGITQVIHIPFHSDITKPVCLDPIVLQPADQVISGFVLDSNDQPVTGALVRIYGSRLSTTVSMPPCGKTLTDAQGRFRVDSICKEPLQIRVTSPPPQKLTGYTWAYGGNKNVRVVLGKRLIFGESLIGKPLPELIDLKLESPRAELNNKMILLCFFDMDQRPSRNCLLQLNKKAKEFKSKDIAVIAIQASKIDEKELNDWTKENNIPFPIGIVQVDEEKTRFTWGVRSLPWLILTDKKHIVTAEGFGIEQLDEEIKKTKATSLKQATPISNPDEPKSFLNAEDILSCWESTYGSIKTMRVSYSVRLVDYRPATNDPNPNLEGLVKYKNIERVESGTRHHIRYSTSEGGFTRGEDASSRDKSYIEQAFNGKTRQTYFGVDRQGLIATGLIGRFTDTENKLKDYMFLKVMPGVGALKEDYPNGLPELSWTFRRRLIRGGITVRPKLESIEGQLCHVVELVRPGFDRTEIEKQIKEVFWMAHDKGMCVMKYHWYWDDKLTAEIEVKEIAMAQMEGKPVWYPRKSYKTSHFDHSKLNKYELTVKEFLPNVEVDDNTFRFDFPPGTNVHDKVTGLSYIISGTDPDR